MAHYEVQRFTENRWLLDAVFRDRVTAVDDAQTLVSRSRAHPPLRVLKVEEHGAGFIETVIYNKAAKRPRRFRDRTPSPHAGPMLAALSAPRTQTGAIRGRAAPADAGRQPALLLLALLLLGGVLILDGGLPSHPHETWVFDRPEAQLPHTVRSPWAGQVSQ